MKEIRTIVSAWQTIDFQLTRAALATVVRVEGSSYRRAGARMLVLDNGTYLGGISGGCLEGDALRRAQKGIALRRPSVITYDTTQDDDYQIGVGLGCQGIVEVLFTPLEPDDPACPLRILAGLTHVRQPAVVVTVTAAPDADLLGQTWRFIDDISFPEALGPVMPRVLADIHQAQAERQSLSVVYGDIRLFIEIVLPALHVVAFGGSYDMRTLLNQVRELGWDSTVVLNTARIDKTLVAAATTVLDSSGPAVPLLDEYSAVLLMSHDYRTDMANLQRVLPSGVSYIGMLGPRKRSNRLFEALAEAGCPIGEEDQMRIYAPAGLDLCAATPDEIALSILAEIRGHFSRRKGGSLRLRGGSIYG